MSVLKLASHLWAHPMSRRHGAVGTFGRFLRWQIAARLMPAGTLLPFVNGSVLVAQRGMTGATGNWYWGVHEAAEMGFVLHALRPGDLFADVGANIGSYTILAACGAGADVVCVEPLPETFARLRRNIAINGVTDRVSPHNCGLSDAVGTIRFTSGQDTMNHVLAADEDGPSLEVPVTTLDALLAGRVPRIIKIDVEGHEAAVLRGAAHTLAAPELRAALMETNGSGRRYGVDDRTLFAVMEGHGFRPFNYDPFARRLVPPTDLSNTIFARDAAALDAICQAAPIATTSAGPL